jgi:hypothetical protein
MDTIEANLSALTEIVGEVARNQRRTDEQLNNLAALVERYIRDGGSSQP